MSPAEMSKLRHAQCRWKLADATFRPTREQTEADRKTFLDAVAEWREAGITVAVAQDCP